MGPDPTVVVSPGDSEESGVIPRAFAALFQSLADKKETMRRETGADLDYAVSVQFLELYGEEIRDLGGGRSSHEKLTIRDWDDEPEVVGATQTPVMTASQALRCLTHGMLRRVTGATAMNESSSRSHAILTVCIEQSVVFRPSTQNDEEEEDPGDDFGDTNSGSNAAGHVQITRSKFNFVDLAGAERQKRTGASGKRLQEGIDINKGLSNLGNVISALGDPKKRGKTHVPYRDAKLTRLLKGSLGGNHKTLMIACVSPAAINMGESLNCLRYANRAKNIQNKAVVNVDANSRLVLELQGQVKALASDLLKSIDGDAKDIMFSRESLLALVGGNSTPAKQLPTPSKSSDTSSDVSWRLRQTERELQKTRDLLQQSHNFQDAAELELHTLRAQNQLYDIQITAATPYSNGESVATVTLEAAFIQKAVEYEREIERLRRSLRDKEGSNEQRIWSPEADDPEQEWLDHEEQVLRNDRDRLESIRAMSFEDAEFDNQTALLKSKAYYTDNTESEEATEEAGLYSSSNKYLQNIDRDDDNSVTIETPSPAANRRVGQVEIDLEELSQNISMKEKLIDQIKRNKERETVSWMVPIPIVFMSYFLILPGNVSSVSSCVLDDEVVL